MKGKYHKRALFVGAVVALLVGTTAALAAQSSPGADVGDVSDSELEGFVNAYVEVQELQLELTDKTKTVLTDSDLGEDRFLAINEMIQEGEPGEDEADVSEDEFDAYQYLLQDIIQIQEDAQTDMVEAVEEEDLTVERFNEIFVALQHDESLATRVQSYYEKALEARDDE